jgi:hypothetical protein
MPDAEQNSLTDEARQEGSIDVWWGSKRHGALMLAHLLGKTETWRRCPLRVLRLVQEVSSVEPTQKGLTTMLESARIRAEAQIVIGSEDDSALIREHSSDAAMAFIGFDPPDKGQGSDFIKHMTALTENLRRVVLVSTHEPDVKREA